MSMPLMAAVGTGRPYGPKSDEPADAVDDDLCPRHATVDLDLTRPVQSGDHAVRDVLIGGGPVDARVARPGDVGREHGDEAARALGLGDGEVDHRTARPREPQRDGPFFAGAQLPA